MLFLTIYPMMINIDLREVVNVRSHARVVALSLLVNFGVAPLLAVGAVLGRALRDAASGVALVYATSMRNLSIAVAVVVAAPAVPETAVLPIAPAYVVQPPLGAVYIHYRRDVAGGDASLSEAVASVI